MSLRTVGLAPSVETFHNGQFAIVGSTQSGKLVRLTDSDASFVDRMKNGVSVAEAAQNRAELLLADELVDAGLLGEVEPEQQRNSDWHRLLKPLAAPSDRLVRRTTNPVFLAIVGLLGIIGFFVVGVDDIQLSRTVPGVSPVVSYAVMLVVIYVTIGIHESSHLLALARFGRTATATGFDLYHGAVSFFVDSSQALLLPRFQRVVQSLAGLYVELGLAGAIAIANSAGLFGVWEGIVWRLVIVIYLDVLLNLIPGLELDGYLALTDLTGRPELKSDAYGALRSFVRRQGSFSWLVPYAIWTLVFSTLMLGVVAWGYLTQVIPILTPVWSEGVVGKVVLIIGVSPLAVAWVLRIARSSALLRNFVKRRATRREAVLLANQALDDRSLRASEDERSVIASYGTALLFEDPGDEYVAPIEGTITVRDEGTRSVQAQEAIALPPGTQAFYVSDLVWMWLHHDASQGAPAVAT